MIDISYSPGNIHILLSWTVNLFKHRFSYSPPPPSALTHNRNLTLHKSKPAMLVISLLMIALILSSPATAKSFLYMNTCGLACSRAAQKQSRTMSTSDFETLKLTSPGQFVKHVELNRPDKRNAMNTSFWKDIHTCFTRLSADPDCRVVVLSGAGKMFTAGLDLYENEIFKFLLSSDGQDASRKAYNISKGIKELQESFNVIEKCSKPVIAAVHNGCIGGGIDMIACCDIRYCTQDAWFQIKEVDIGLAADLGTIQRFPKIIGNDSLFRELAYTCRKFDAEEAKSMGFVSRILSDKNSLMEAAIELAKQIASKSPVAVQGTKVNAIYSRDHGVYNSLEYMANWNSAMLQSEDVGKAVSAAIQKDTPVFSKL